MGWNRGRGGLKCLDTGLPFYTSPQHQSGRGPLTALGSVEVGISRLPALIRGQLLPIHTALDREQMFFLRASLFLQQEVFFLSFHKGCSKRYRIKTANTACASPPDTNASPSPLKSIFCLFSLSELTSRGQANTSLQNLVVSDTEVHNFGDQWLTSHEKVTYLVKHSDHQERIQLFVCCGRAWDKGDFKFCSPPHMIHAACPSTGRHGAMNPQASRLDLLVLNSKS